MPSLRTGSEAPIWAYRNEIYDIFANGPSRVPRFSISRARSIRGKLRIRPSPYPGRRRGGCHVRYSWGAPRKGAWGDVARYADVARIVCVCSTWRRDRSAFNDYRRPGWGGGYPCARRSRNSSVSPMRGRAVPFFTQIRAVSFVVVRGNRSARVFGACDSRNLPIPPACPRFANSLGICAPFRAGRASFVAALLHVSVCRSLGNSFPEFAATPLERWGQMWGRQGK